MPKAITFRKIIQKSQFELPASLNREIGKIIVRWAYLEHYLQRFVWAVTFLGDDKGAILGRIAIREPKVADRLMLMKEVASVREVTYDSALMKSMIPRIKDANENRDWLAHGMWTDTGEAGWAIQVARGTWQEYRQGPRGSKQVSPEAIPMGLDELRETTSKIETLIADAKRLHASLEHKPTSSR